MQKYPTHQLHVKCTQAKSAPGCFAAIRKGLGQDRVQSFAIFDAGLEFRRFLDESRVTKGFEFRLQRVDFFHQRACCLDLAVIRRAENLIGNRSKSEHVLSVPVFRLFIGATACPARRAPLEQAQGATLP